MPAKYSHTKKRPPSVPKKTTNSNAQPKKDHRTPNIHVDRSISQAMSAVSTLERAIARILLIRFEHDIARLFSTHLYCVALLHLPTFVMRCITVGGPGWVAATTDCDEIKDYFRAVIGMDLRQAGERVATKSVLWSYTALRHFVGTLLIFLDGLWASMTDARMEGHVKQCPNLFQKGTSFPPTASTLYWSQGPP